MYIFFIEKKVTMSKEKEITEYPKIDGKYVSSVTSCQDKSVIIHETNAKTNMNEQLILINI